MVLTFQSMVSKETVPGNTEADAHHGAARWRPFSGRCCALGPSPDIHPLGGLRGLVQSVSHSCSGVMVFLVLPVSRAARRLVIPASPYWAVGYVQALSC